MKTTYFTMPIIAGLAVVLGACGGGGGDGAADGPIVGQNGTIEVAQASAPGCGSNRFAQEMVAQLNAVRAQARSCGSRAMPAVGPIRYWNTKLTDAANRHSSDMAAKNFLSHTGSDGSEPADRVIQAGYPSGGLSEIIGLSTGGALGDAITARNIDWWLTSASHCEAIMMPEASEIGAACVQTGNQAYVTVIFGN